MIIGEKQEINKNIVESTDIAIVGLAIATLINARNVDWKSKTTYKVSAITLTVIALVVALFSIFL
tara:strand:+ start:299 stop:493 length:195 start_codon:yes stop_codon:yes gene_type:complete